MGTGATFRSFRIGRESAPGVTLAASGTHARGTPDRTSRRRTCRRLPAAGSRQCIVGRTRPARVVTHAGQDDLSQRTRRTEPVLTSLLIRLFAAAVSVSAGPQPSRPPAGPSLERPCSFVTAAEMAGMLGAPVASATDEH